MEPELNDPIRSSKKTRFVLLIYTLLVIVVSLLPGSGTSYGQADKIGHFLAYAGMAILALLSFERRIPRQGSLLGAIALGALLEWGQSFIPGRDMSVVDGLANALGVLAGALLFHSQGQFIRKRIQSILGE